MSDPADPRCAPASLTGDGNALAAWADLVAAYDPVELTALRRVQLEAVAQQVARVRDAAERIAQEGLVVADEWGVPAPHPALEIERLAQAELRAWTKTLS